MKLSRLTPVLFVVWLVFFMVANNILPVTDALSVAAMFQALRTFSRRWLAGLVGSSILGTSLMFWAVAHGVITDMVLLYTT